MDARIKSATSLYVILSRLWSWLASICYRRVCYSPLITTHLEKRDLEIVGMLRELRFRASRYGVLPYFHMPFGDNARDDAIAEIVVGPKNVSNDNLLKMLLLSLGYRKASVRRSSASYR